MDLIAFLKQVLPEGIGIYDARLIPAGKGWHLEVQLDGLDDPTGAVSVDVCSKCSHKFVELIDYTVLSGKSGESPLPETLDVEDYSMEVSSAGAERKLRLPGDLERFKAKPLRLKYRMDGTILSELVVFRNTENEKNLIVFDPYVPRRKKAGSGRSLKAALELDLSDIIEVSLYLDY